MWKELLPAPLSSGGHTRPASSLELWHAIEDNRGKLQRKALLWLRPELLSFVCGGREDSQGHYLDGRTTLVGEVQEKALHAWSKPWENFWCLSPTEQSQKALFMCLSLWAPERHLYPNFYYHTCPEMQPPCWIEQLHDFFPSKIAATTANFISKRTTVCITA